jgi:hypothetical protein
MEVVRESGLVNLTEKFDLLLTYLSERGEGTWQELKEAWTWISGQHDDPSNRAWMIARDLEALGHIEVAWDYGLRWCAAPPLLTMVPRSGGRAFVTGARTRYFTGRLNSAAEELDLWVDSCMSQRGPTSIYLACSSNLAAEKFAEILGVGYTYQVAEQIAGILPPLDSYSRLAEERDLPGGLEVELFDTRSLSWDSTDTRAVPGLYRCRTYEGVIHGLLDPTNRWSRVIKEVGIYEVLRWEGRTVIAYSDGDEKLTVGAGARLPALHARAATLCCGQLPLYRPARDTQSHSEQARERFRRAQAGVRGTGVKTPSRSTPVSPAPTPGTLIYSNVTRPIAESIALSLCQKLEDDLL